MLSLMQMVQVPLAMIPADGDPLLMWMRNQLLVWSYIALHMAAVPVFFFAQLFYNDGKAFLPFMNQIMTL